MKNTHDQAFLDKVDGDWTAICQNEWELLTGVILDARTPVEHLRRCLQRLRRMSGLDQIKGKLTYLDFRTLNKCTVKEAQEVLRQVSYPWWRQKGPYFSQPLPTFNLLHASFEQIDSIKGIGPKLASLWMRIMNPEQKDKYVVIDTHVRRWLRKEWNIDDSKRSYAELSALMRESARQRRVPVSVLDQWIVEAGISARQARRKKDVS